MSGFWNTREIKHFFAYIETIYCRPAECSKNKANLIAALGMTLEEYNWNIEWTENLIRNYYKAQGSMNRVSKGPESGQKKARNSSEILSIPELRRRNSCCKS